MDGHQGDVGPVQIYCVARTVGRIGPAGPSGKASVRMVVLRAAIPRVTELSVLLTLRQLEWATSAAPVVFWGPSSCVLVGPVRSAIDARCFAQSSNA